MGSVDAAVEGSFGCEFDDCRRSSSGLGMPGVGVAPGFAFCWRRISSGLGMPGVGVAPFGIFELAVTVGMPGTFTLAFRIG